MAWILLFKSHVTTLLPIERIEQKILWIRGQKVMIDVDLAEIYGVTPKRLREQVRRNRARFPEDFMFQLSKEEQREVAANCGHLRRLKFSPSSAYAFTEHGAIMLASVLNSPVAIRASVQVVRAFVRLRQLLATHKDLARKLEELEKKYDSQFKIVFDAIRELMSPPPPKTKRIGFRA